MNFAGSLRVAARGSALSVSDRGIGSANGNRTCIAPVQSGSVRSKSVQTRSVGTARPAKKAPQSAGVPARCQRGHSRVGAESRPDTRFSGAPLTGDLVAIAAANSSAK